MDQTTLIQVGSLIAALIVVVVGIAQLRARQNQWEHSQPTCPHHIQAFQRVHDKIESGLGETKNLMASLNVEMVVIGKGVARIEERISGLRKNGDRHQESIKELYDKADDLEKRKADK